MLSGMATTKEVEAWRKNFNSKNRKERIEHVKSLLRPQRRLKSPMYSMFGSLLFGRAPNAKRTKGQRTIDAFHETMEDLHYLGGAAVSLLDSNLQAEAETLLLESYLVVFGEASYGASAVRRYRQQSEKILRFIEKLERKHKRGAK